MKKKYLIIFILLMIPCIVKSKTFAEATDIASTYMERSNFADHSSRYIETGGGLIDKTTYEIVLNNKINEKSYLYDGNKYWTETEANSQVYVIPEMYVTHPKTSVTPSVRVVETVKKDARVIGLGTKESPWIFIPINKIELKSNYQDTLSPTCNSSYADESVIYSSTDTISTVCINPSVVVYVSNDCGSFITKSSNTLRISNVTRDITCNIRFAKTVTIAFDKMGGTGGSDNVTAPAGSAMPSIAIPTKEGSTFAGYYLDKNYTLQKYYNADGSSAHVWDGTEPITLYAKWTN